jgi:predicted metal-dependent HD superfamily phosphohydrolase
MGELAQEWTRSAVAAGGDAARAASDGAALEAAYLGADRHYHGAEHIAAVLRGIDELAGPVGLSQQQTLLARLAACAHDVVYAGAAGDDERDSAAWAQAALIGAGVAAALAADVARLVLATADHRADDPAAQVLLDADLRILAAPRPEYLRYCAQVREEYRRLPDQAWRTGRAAVLRSLIDRDALYLTRPARLQWERAARANIAAELADLAELAGPPVGAAG